MLISFRMQKITDISIQNAFLSGSSSGNLNDPNNISKYVSAFIVGSISIAGIILLYLLIMGGIGIIAGAGKNDPKAVEMGKKTATSALIGFVVVFTAYWIVKLIENILGVSLI